MSITELENSIMKPIKKSVTLMEACLIAIAMITDPIIKICLHQLLFEHSKM